MLYKLAHIIMSAFPWLWECVEWINDILFRIRYHKSLRNIIGMVSEKDIDDLTEFFASQPESSFLYFRPHSFDRHHLLKLIHRSSMMMHVIYMDGKIAGYCFLRCFFIGKGYRGYIVDTRYRQKGIGKSLGIWLNDTAETLGLRTFKSINDDNLASLRLAQATCKLKKIQEMENGDAEYECIIEK